MLQVESPNGGHQVLICKYGEVNDSEYLDPLGNCVVQFDHIKQEVVGSRQISGELDMGCEDYRKAFDKCAQDYIASHYINGAATVYGSSQGGNTIRVCISSSKFNPNNFWTGRWRSVWTCTINGNNIKLEGNIKLLVHYYEDGNVQLSSDTNKSGSASGGNAQAAAAAALKQIDRIETEFQNQLNQSYSTMGDTTFKALRRALPITREPIKWEKINTYKLATR
eukprot:TRINITY_DN3412_c0_g1_i3.p1 TRINITY_DN3412_c0_g1~~TRINITY_DN3412_c0_g1_i3.p1  ORF type:complete len:223 (+),score=70.44 TRINITY_DN3412_c0_g1_i3:139-807(+)